MAPTPAAVAAALTGGFQIARQLTLGELDTQLVVLRAPANLSTRRALARLRALDPAGSYDYNHLYVGSASSPTETAAAPSILKPESGAAVARIGLIDGGVDVGHPDFAGVELTVSGCGGTSHPSAHGTAVASLLVAAGAVAAAPSSITLQSADVFCDQPDGGGVDALAQGFAELVRAQVSVINISLVGPRNLSLELLVRAVQRRGILIVAAVGNDGPAARPLYPAAFPGVIGVTAVDGKRRVLAEACRGEHVQFAAPGAGLLAADLAHGHSPVRGTSFAAPIVAGLLARTLADSNGDAQSALQQLTQQAVDLGKSGRDSIYGWGLVGASLPVAAAMR
jgi:subtilisin family serine protease